MKEILVNSISNVEYRIFVDGVPADASAIPKVTVKKAGATVVDNQDATKPADTTGLYRYLLPATATVDGEVLGVITEEGILDVTWSFTVSSQTFEITEQYDVVTPYAPWSYFMPESGTEPSYQDYLECERVVRYIINAHCGQEFGQEYAVLGVEGHDTNALLLPRRLQVFEEVEWSSADTLRPGGLIGVTEQDWEVIADGWVLRSQPYPYGRRVDYPDRSRFVRNRTYNVTGLWGYPSVPTSVQEAAKILIADLMCADHKYRDRYLDNIKMGDWRLQFTAGAFERTGNVLADQLLVDYRISPSIGLV